MAPRNLFQQRDRIMSLPLSLPKTLYSDFNLEAVIRSPRHPEWRRAIYVKESSVWPPKDGPIKPPALDQMFYGQGLNLAAFNMS